MHGKEYHWFVRYVLAILDATIYPANAASLKSAMTTMNTVLNLSQNNIGHVMLPVIQSNTTSQALVKHARIIEDSFIGSGFDTTGKVALHLQKPLDAAANDKRGGLQTCLALSGGKDCAWVSPVVIGPLTLVKVSEMIGYSEDSRPGATARAEQILAFISIFLGPSRFSRSFGVKS